MTRRRLAVWGDPIAHSKSPALHAAAYGVLGLDWEYGRQQVNVDGFDDALRALDQSWRGLSLTMPLKESAYRAAASHDRSAALTGAVNTLHFVDGSVNGHNTDVGGIIDALADESITELGNVRILGAGATAASALVAATDLGAVEVEVRARRPERAAALVALGNETGVDARVVPFDAPVSAVDLTIATLPTGTRLPDDLAVHLASAGGVLFDAAYAPWPSALATAWGSGVAVSGIGMLLHQAVRQIRIFVHGDPLRELEQEPVVIAAMREAADAPASE